MSVKILFMGTPDFSCTSLLALLNNFSEFEFSVITMPDKVRTRGKKVSPAPVKLIAQKNNLDVYTPSTKKDVTDLIFKINPDLIIVVAYGMIIEKTVVDSYFCINVHASLLPKYRGASPIQAALLNGDLTTGVTLIQLNEFMDAGPILLKRECDINPTDNHGVLSEKLAELGAKLLVEFIAENYLLNQVVRVEQNHSEASYCKKILKNDLIIDDSMSVNEIHCKIKAFSPKPGAFILQDSKRIKLLESKIENNEIILIVVQPEGKSPMQYSDYLLGNPNGVNIYGQ